MMMLDIITDCLMRMRYRACSRFTGNPGELLAHIHVGTSGLARWSSGFLTSNSTLGRMRLPVKSFCLLTVSLLVAACAQRTRQPIPARVPAAFSGDSPSRNTSTDSTREYTGEWETGFESSIFRGCNGSTPPKVWISLAPGATVGARWSESNIGGANARTYYVRVRGILRGPAAHRRIGDGYGHLGGADYELYVIRVLEVKPPGEPNCVVRR